MCRKSYLLISLFLLRFSVVILAGDSVGVSEKWVPDDGIYMNCDDLARGNPRYHLADVYTPSHYENYSLRLWSRTTRLLVVNEAGNRVSLRDSVYAVCENGTVSLFRGGKFHEILEFGRICYFKETFPVVMDQMSPVVTETYASASYYLLELKTGKLYEYSANNLEFLIRDDKELLQEFRSIKKTKDRRARTYLYLEKYNIRNTMPLI
jgi:hypothetical protein